MNDQAFPSLEGVSKCFDSYLLWIFKTWPNLSYSFKSLSTLVTMAEPIRWHRASSSFSLFKDRFFLSYTSIPTSSWASLRLIKSKFLEITSILSLSNTTPLKPVRSLACYSRNQWSRLLPTALTKTCSFRLCKPRTLSSSKPQQLLNRLRLLLLNEKAFNSFKSWIRDTLHMIQTLRSGFAGTLWSQMCD